MGVFKISKNVKREEINKKSNVLFLIILICCLILIGRVYYISVVKNEEYRNKTIAQSLTEQSVKASRGTIYDRDMNVLAVSITVEDVCISPYDIPQMTCRDYLDLYIKNEGISEKKAESAKEELGKEFANLNVTVADDISTELSEILGIDKQIILEKTTKIDRKYVVIQKEVNQVIADKIRDVISRKHYEQYIYLNDESKRSYPCKNNASHAIGFVNAEGDGVVGIEAYYNKLLGGVDGKILTAVNGVNGEMPYKYENYVEAEDGTNIMLTLDVNIEKILENHLATCLTETQAQNGVLGIVMDVNNGEILGMSNLPDYDLNNPYVLDANSQALLDGFVGTDEEYNNYNVDLLYSMWNNKAVVDTYEPGSTFKMVTASMAKEENLINSTETFNCVGRIYVEGYSKPINCHLLSGHGIQTFEQALWHSCNPVFVTIGLRVGTDRFYKYYKAFGYLEKTGIDLPGETLGIWHSSFHTVELAASSFGQTFTVTPIQHITAACAVANGGYLVTPHLLKATLDDNGNIVDSYDTAPRRQVISEETSKTIVGYMAGGVANGGSSRNAYVKGYSVAAKTGTTVKTAIRTATGETKYIGSCIAFAPAENPQVAVMVLVDEPVGTYYGGTIAAPVVSKIMGDVLEYLGIDPTYSDDDISKAEIIINNYVGETLTDAKEKIVADGFNYKVIGKGVTVLSQVPRAGESLAQNGTIYLVTEENLDNMTTVPDVKGLTSTAANSALINSSLNISISGVSMDYLDGAISVSQSVEPGTIVEKGTVVSVDFRHYSNITD